MSRSLPHLTLTTSTSSVSPISSTFLIFPTVAPLHTSPMILDPCINPAIFHGRVADQHKSHLEQKLVAGTPKTQNQKKKRGMTKKNSDDPLADISHLLTCTSGNNITAKVVSSKHSISIHFPKDRNCDVCLRTKIPRAPCRRRTGEAPPCAEKFGDFDNG